MLARGPPRNKREQTHDVGVLAKAFRITASSNLMQIMDFMDNARAAVRANECSPFAGIASLCGAHRMLTEESWRFEDPHRVVAPNPNTGAMGIEA